MSITINHQEDKISSTTNIISSYNTGGLIVPKGNDGVDKPSASSTNNGLIRYNTTTNAFEAVINGSYSNLTTSSGLFSYVSTVGGTGTAITLTPDTAITSYQEGQMFTFKVANSNSSSPVTVNVSEVGNIPLKICYFTNGLRYIIDPPAYSLIEDSVITIVYQSGFFQPTSTAFMDLTTASLSASLTGVESVVNGVIKGAIDGLTLSTNGTSFGVDVGSATNSTNTLSLVLGSAFTNCVIQTTGVWTAGNSTNKLDADFKTNNTCYHVFVISNVLATVVDVLVSLSPTAPSLPSGYTLFRRIGSLFTDGSGNIIQFIQRGDEFVFSSPSVDVNVTNLGTSASTYTIASVPTGVIVKATFNMVYSSQTANTALYISSLDTTDLAPSVTVAPLATAVTDEINKVNGQQIQCFTNTSAQIRARAGNVNTSLALSTISYKDYRGKK